MEKCYFIYEGYWKDYITTNGTLDENYCQIQGWKDFVHVCIMHQSPFWEACNILYEKRLCINTLERKELNLSPKVNKLAWFANSYYSF